MNTDKKSVGGRPLGATAPRSDVVRRVRDALGMTQEEFAGEMSVSVNTVAKMEQQGREPGTRAGKEALAKLAKRAGIEVGT